MGEQAGDEEIDPIGDDDAMAEGDAQGPGAADQGRERREDQQQDQDHREGEPHDPPVLDEAAAEVMEDRHARRQARVRALPRPMAPTSDEKEYHNLCHYPSQSWCRHCVRAKGRNMPHRRLRRHDHDGEGVPVVSGDYCFLGDEDDEASVPCFVVRDHQSRLTFAHALQGKATNEVYGNFLVRAIVADIARLGYRKVRFRTDQEPSCLALQTKVKKQSDMEVVLQNSPVGESQSNGVAEKAVQEVEDQVRCLKVALEENINDKISKKSCVLPWLVEHAAWLYNHTHVGKDGFTAAERENNGVRKELPSLAEFGEQVLYKPLSSSAGRVENLAARFLDGTFLGVEPRTGELRIGTASGVIKARSIRRRLEEERWSSTALQNLTGTPWDPTPGTAAAQGGTTAGELDEKKDPILPKEHTEPGHLARRTRLTREDFEAHGFTPGCYGCRLLREGGEKSGGHNEVCRQRMEAAISSTAGGKDRVEEGYQRLASEAMRISEREARRVGGEVSEAVAARGAAQGMADWFRGDLSEWRAWSAAGKDRKDYGEWRKVYLDEKVRLLREAGLQQARKRRDEAGREAGRPVEEDPMPRGGDGRKRVHVADG